MTQIFQISVRFSLVCLSWPASAMLALCEPMLDPVRRITELSNYVLQVETQGGSKFVLRKGSTNGSLDRERFATEFVRSIPHLDAPKVKTLTNNERRDVLRNLRKVSAQLAGWTGDGEPQALNIVEFRKGTIGRKALSALGVSHPLMDWLSAIAGGNVQLSPSAKPVYREFLIESWHNLNVQERRQLSEDIENLVPKFRRSKDMLQTLLQNFDSIPGSNLSQLTRVGLKRLHPELLAQLADYWMIYTVLGIPDFHPSNWLVDGTKVIGIDLAHPRRASHNNNPLELPAHQHPLGVSELDDEIRALLQSSIQPKTVTYLKSLSEPEIRAMASAVQYSITDSEIEEILDRIWAL